MNPAAPGCAVAIAHPNVALVKYWGKRAGPGNLPATGSLSITLGGLSTRTRVCFDPALARDQVTVNGERDARVTDRVAACLDLLRHRAGVTYGALVESHNDFPTGAGLASSASGFAALVTAGAGALGLDIPAAELAGLARSGSGSAARSMYGGFVVLTNQGDTTACETVAAPADWPLCVVVAITTTGPKTVGSTDGMVASDRTSPYFRAWTDSHAADLVVALEALRRRDLARLGEVTEHNCLKMHAVMMTTRPPLLYWSAATLACIHRVRALREGGVPVYFTVDAGPQVKAICPPEAAARVAQELAQVPGVIRTLCSTPGEGAHLIGSD